MQLSKIDSKFRLLVDQIFFTDRTDLDISEFSLLFDNRDDHYNYLWDRFVRSSEIFWEEAFWINRFNLLLSLNPRKIGENIESFLLTRFRNLIISNHQANPKHDNQYIQFIAWVKVKSLRKENLISIQEFFSKLPYSIQASRLLGIVDNFIPFLFQNTDEYLKLLSKRVAQSARNFEVIQQLERMGSKVDKAILYKLSSDLLFKRAPNRKNRRSFFTMLNDPDVMTHLKSEYKISDQPVLLKMLRVCEYKEIEEYHLRNVKNLLELDSTIADDLMLIYADRLYGRGVWNKKANIQRLVRLCKNHPQFSPKKLLAYLSFKNKMSDIKHLISAFPELKPLVPFI